MAVKLDAKLLVALDTWVKNFIESELGRIKKGPRQIGLLFCLSFAYNDSMQLAIEWLSIGSRCPRLIRAEHITDRVATAEIRSQSARWAWIRNFSLQDVAYQKCKSADVPELSTEILEF